MIKVTPSNLKGIPFNKSKEFMQSNMGPICLKGQDRGG